IRSPNIIQQLAVSQNAIGMANHHFKEFVLDAGQVHVLSRDCDFSAKNVDFNVAYAKKISAFGGSRPQTPQNDAKPRAPFADGEWLVHIVVRDCIECGNFVVLTRSDREDDDGKVRAPSADLTNDFDSIQVGQSQI